MLHNFRRKFQSLFWTYQNVSKGIWTYQKKPNKNSDQKVCIDIRTFPKNLESGHLEFSRQNLKISNILRSFPRRRRATHWALTTLKTKRMMLGTKQFICCILVFPNSFCLPRIHKKARKMSARGSHICKWIIIYGQSLEIVTIVLSFPRRRRATHWALTSLKMKLMMLGKKRLPLLNISLSE